MRYLLALLVIIVVGCGDDNNAMDMARDMSATDQSVGDMAFKSACGKPGDTGNSLGVGKFCEEQSECAGNGQATICSSLTNTGGAEDTFFCTKACDANQPVAAQCGENARCDCRMIGCGCVPDKCVTPTG